MNVFKKSRRWLCANLVLLAGMVALGAAAPPTTAASGGGRSSLIPECQSEGPEGGPYTDCVYRGGACGLVGQPGTGTCVFVDTKIGCRCQ